MRWASGTVQALREDHDGAGDGRAITLPTSSLNSAPFSVVVWKSLKIEELTLERALVFPSGLALSIAIFTELNIQCMTLAGGVLREGLVYGMLHRWSIRTSVVVRCVTFSAAFC
ncbi:hypothetical protein ACNKHS_22640 [Shigella flexneri]